MSYIEIFSELSSHFIKGMMVHDQMANYYDFLSLRGYKRYHEYQFKCDSCNYRKLNRFYINHYGRLIADKPVSDPNLIPDTWYRYSREDVDIQTKKTAIRNGIAEWIRWETATLAKLQQAQLDLYDDGEVASAMFINKFIKAVTKELKCARRLQLDLNAVDYDMPYIIGEQKRIHDKYKAKL